MNSERVSLIPMTYMRWVRRDTGALTRVLQQWWSTPGLPLELPDSSAQRGEWRDIPEEKE